jgi:2,3-dihydroxyphenylpropionate 1,2-dioxygenase
MVSTVVGARCCPMRRNFHHARDRGQGNVEKVRAVAREIGDKLKAMADLWIIFSNDHAEQFFLNGAAFTIHVGGEATGEFAGRSLEGPERDRLRAGARTHRQNFDPAFTSTARIGTPSAFR